MKCGDLSSLYQLGVAMNWGFGAVLIFAQPAKRLFDQSISTLESRLIEINEAQGKNVEQSEIDRAFELNRTYFQLASDAKYLSLEAYVWQSIPSRLVFLLSGLGCFTGLISSAYFADRSASIYNFCMAVGLNFFPMTAAGLLFAGWCWFEYKILPRVENLEEQMFFGPRALASELRRGASS